MCLSFSGPGSLFSGDRCVLKEVCFLDPPISPLEMDPTPQAPETHSLSSPGPLELEEEPIPEVLPEPQATTQSPPGDR